MQHVICPSFINIFYQLTPAATCASYQYCSSGLSAVMAKSANIAVKAVK